MTSFKKLFGPHAVSLLIAVLAATFMWYMVCVRDRIEAQYEVFVDYHGVSPKLVITEGLVSKLTIRLRGPETLLRSLGKRHLTQQVDLSKVKKGVTVVPLTPEEMHGDLRAFDIIDIEPARMVVKADNLAERNVTVKPVVSSPLRTGALTVGDVSISPSSVTIKGPESIVSDMSSIKLFILLDPKAAGTTLNQSMNLDTPNLVTATPSAVRVQYTMTSGRTAVARRLRVAIGANKPEAFLVEPAELDVAVEVPDALAKSSSYLAKIAVSAIPPELAPGESARVRLHYRLPEGMTLLPPLTEEVTVTRRGGSKPGRSARQEKQEKQEKQDGEADLDGEAGLFN